MSEWEDKLFAEHMAKVGCENEVSQCDEDSKEKEDTGMGCVDLDTSGPEVTD